ncbi:hypothetical protein J6590_040770 [Homalodisca vitripennis]|nr:hypothetical protein J6590_040770 [Homalodisca vitripennis]
MVYHVYGSIPSIHKLLYRATVRWESWNDRTVTAKPMITCGLAYWTRRAGQRRATSRRAVPLGPYNTPHHAPIYTLLYRLIIIHARRNFNIFHALSSGLCEAPLLCAVYIGPLLLFFV